jgi:formylglycine-generating enzyme required for sulfatase activity
VRAIELRDLVDPFWRRGVRCDDSGIPDVVWTTTLAGLAIAVFPTTNAHWGAYRANHADVLTPSPEATGNDTAPVVGVSWTEATAYCRWLSQLLDAEVRLPTVDEWKIFAAGPEGSPYPFGEWKDNVANTRAAKLGAPSVVGAFPNSVAPSGAHDMVGNVWEWCDDQTEGPLAPLKGGSWASYTHHSTIGSVAHLPKGGRYDDVGFRVLLVTRRSS